MNIVLSLIALVLGSIGLLKWLGFFKTGAFGGNQAVNIGLLILPLSLLAGSSITLLQIWVVKAPVIETVSYASLGYLFFPVSLAYFFLLGLISSKIGSWFFWFAHGLLLIGLSYRFNNLADGASHFDFALGMWAVASALWLANWLKACFKGSKFLLPKTMLTFLMIALPSLFSFYLFKYSALGLPYAGKSIFSQSLATAKGILILVACVFILQNFKKDALS